MHLVSIQSASPRSLTVGGREITTGIFKEPVANAIVGELGLEGDAVINTRHHGGPDQALYVYSQEDYEWWEDQLDQRLPPGVFGENLTFSSFGNSEVMIGDRWTIGSVVLETTGPRLPCATFGSMMGDGAFPKRFRQARRPGFYVRVIRGGSLTPGTKVTRLSSAHNVSVLEMFDLAYNPQAPGDVLQRILAAPIAERARSDYERRLRKSEN